MSISLPSKHNAADTTIFTVMSTLAQQHSAINLSQGFPDFTIDPKLSQLLHEASEMGFNQYAPMAGLPVLRDAIKENFKTRYEINIDANSEITITPGATYAIYAAFSAILKAGDEVIVLEPAYDSYLPNIEMNGAKAVIVALEAPLFNVDWNKVKSAITNKTKAIIVNTPHNPTGSIWKKEDWQQLADLIRPTDIVVISDEVYEQLVYDGKLHYSVLQHPELRERSFAIYSFGKVFHNTGWKIGYCIAPSHFTAAFRRLHQFIGFSVNTPAQYALANYISQPNLQPVNIMLEQKRNYFLQLMRNTAFRMLAPSAGSYFQLASYDGISLQSDTQFAHWLTETHAVATIPVSAFYSDKKDDKLIRFCFAKKETTLLAAVERLSEIKSII
jgi:methionine aminotransferase